MGGQAAKKKSDFTTVNKKASVKKKLSNSKQAKTSKNSEINAKKSKPSVKAEKKKNKLPAQYESLILDHRENGRKLARSILRRWRVHMPGEEVDSIVDLALCEAAQRFSPKKGASFMTFFFYHLRGHLVRAVARATQASSILNGPKEDDDSDANTDLISSYGTFIDNELNAQRDQENPEQIILRREKIIFCRDAMNALDSLEQIVLERSYGSDETLVDIAKSLGYSRCHISRVKKSALSRLKTVLSNSSLTSDHESKSVRKTALRLQRNEKICRRKLNSSTNAGERKSNSKAA
jgi:RNA polymerase sigma factor (sigma-70 family)